MKPIHSRPARHALRFPLCAVLLALCTLLLALNSATAASYQWDVNGATAGLGGPGAWTAGNTFWDLLGTGGDTGTDTTVAYPNLAGDTYNFGGTAGTVTVANGFTANGTVNINVGTYIFTCGANSLVQYSGLITISSSGTTSSKK